MSLYCGTFDVAIFGQVAYQQIGFASLATYNSWIQGTLIPKAMDFVDNYVGHNFLSNSGTIVLDGSGKEVQHITRIGLVDDGAGLLPAQLLPVPLMTLTQVDMDGITQTLTDFQVYDTFVTYEDNCFCTGRQNIEFQATWGYSSVPHDVQAVTAMLCANLLTEMVRKRKIPDLITPVLEGDRDLVPIFRIPRVLTESEKEILNRYRFRETEIG